MVADCAIVCALTLIAQNVVSGTCVVFVAYLVKYDAEPVAVQGLRIVDDISVSVVVHIRRAVVVCTTVYCSI